jgi:hypothetical protein
MLAARFEIFWGQVVIPSVNGVEYYRHSGDAWMKPYSNAVLRNDSFVDGDKLA